MKLKKVKHIAGGNKVTLTKDWKNIDGIVYPAGSKLTVTNKILNELTEGGFLTPVKTETKK